MMPPFSFAESCLRRHRHTLEAYRFSRSFSRVPVIGHLPGVRSAVIALFPSTTTELPFT